MRYAIVCTTIFLPNFLESYCVNIEKYGHKNDVKFYIIPDKKTPKEAAELVNNYKAKGFNIEYVELPFQEEYLNRFPSLKEKIPYNSDNRRNIGYLMAYEEKADIIISIDDDNYPLDEYDFIGGHAVVGKEKDISIIESSNKWYNICGLLEVKPSIMIYPRGFPYRIRKDYEKAKVTTTKGKVRIGINAGLWTNDPDIDAISRNFQEFKVSKWKEKAVILGKNTWATINTQNTSLTKELLPAFYYVKMGFDIGGTKIDRFGDILAGYFCQRVAKELGYAIRAGDPICEHKRNVHNLFDDLHHEWAGIVLLEDITHWLEDVKIKGDNAKELYLSLAKQLEKQADIFKDYLWNEQSRNFIKEISSCMSAWIEAISKIDHER